MRAGRDPSQLTKERAKIPIKYLGDCHVYGLGNDNHPVGLAAVEPGGELALVHHRRGYAVGGLVSPVGDDLDQALVAPPVRVSTTSTWGENVLP